MKKDNLYLNKDEQRDLIIDIRNGKRDITELIEFLDPLIKSTIKRWNVAIKKSSLTYDDLYQQAMVLLIRSIDMFDCNVKGVKFSSYYISSLNRVFITYIKKYSTTLSGTSHTDIKYINNNLNMISDKITIDGEEINTIDFFLNKDNQLNSMEDYINYSSFYKTIENIFSFDKKLKNNKKYKKIFDMIFFERLTYEETSNKLGVSKQRVGQVMKKIYEIFRKKYKDDLKPFRELEFNSSIIEELKELKII